MTLRRAIAWGVVAVLLLFAARFVWYEMTRDPAEQEFVAEREAPVETADPGPAGEAAEDRAEEPAGGPAGEEPAAKPAGPGPSGEEAAEAAAEEGPADEQEARGDEAAPPPGREDAGAADPEPQPEAETPAAGEAPPAPGDAGAPAPGSETSEAPEPPASGAGGAPGAGSEEAAATLPGAGAGSPSPDLDEAAADYVANLAKPTPEPILGERAAHFVGADQEIRFGPAGKDSLPGSIAAAANPEDAGSPAEKTGPTAARAEPPKGGAAGAGEPVSGKDGTTAPGRTPARRAAEGPAAEAASPAREGAAGPDSGREAPGEDAAPTRSVAPMRKADDDVGALVSGAEAPAPGKDGTTAPGRTPARRTAEGPAAEAASPAREGAAEREPGREAPGEDAAPTRSVAPMRKADDDVGALVSGAEAPAPGKDAPAAGPSGKPPESAAGPASGPAGPAAVGKGEDGAAAAGAAAGSRGPGETPAPREAITIRELLRGTVEVGEHDIFYVHAVTPDDHQGLWGIIQQAVAENFARGVRITLGERTDTYRVTVPENADELLDDRSSSPLGLMIHQKSRKTIVYNREIGRLTQDPDVTLYPGNEIIIVGFEPEELIRLYKHFANADGG